MQLLMTKAETAGLLRMSERRFDQLRPRLEKIGFPKPVKGLGCRWHRLALESWLDNAAGRLPAAAGVDGEAERDTTGSPSTIADMRQRLELRYAGGRS